MRVLLVILDGLGDESIPNLNQTPLELASRDLVVLNMFAQRGLCGILYPIAPGVPPASDTGHLAIFGYDLTREYPGRGYFEAMGAGIKPDADEIAFRANLATVRKEGQHLIVIDRRAGRISGDDAEALYNMLNNALEERGYPVRILHTFEHRGVLLIKGKEYLGAVSDTDPHEVNVPLKAAVPLENLNDEDAVKAKKTARLINEISKLAYRVLSESTINKLRIKKGLPIANAILIRGGGRAKRIPSFMEKWGYKSAFVAGGNLYKGLARALGMDEIRVEGATGTVNTNLAGKINGAIKALEGGYDFVYLHIKGTDTLSHDKKPLEKARFIKLIDFYMEPLLYLEDTLIIVTGDHSTSSVRGRHIGLPVPIVFYSTTIRKDEVPSFNEKYCARGSLGAIRGMDVMRIINDLTNRSIEHGTVPSNVDLILD